MHKKEDICFRVEQDVQSRLPVPLLAVLRAGGGGPPAAPHLPAALGARSRETSQSPGRGSLQSTGGGSLSASSFLAPSQVIA